MGEQDMEPAKRRRGTLEGGESSIYADVPKAVLEEGSWTAAYFRGLVRGALRKIYFRWPGKKIAFDRVRVEVPGTTKSGKPTKRPGVWYKCQQCGVLGKAQVGKTNPKGYKRMWCDHIEPVVPLDRYPDWREYIERLFCDPDNFEILCDDCHHVKSQAERQIRRENARREKAAKEPPAGD